MKKIKKVKKPISKKFSKKKIVKKTTKKIKAKSATKPKTVKKKRIDPSLTLPVSVEPIVEKKVSTMYFTTDTEKAIVEFNATADHNAREKLYVERIQYAFEKIAENIFNTFKFSYNEVSPIMVQRECISHMVMNIAKYDQSKGKAFGYFSIVAKHWFILENNTNYKRFKKQVEIIDEPGTTGEFVVQPEHEKQDRDNQEFIRLMVKYWDDHINAFFPKERDKRIADAVIEIFRKSDRIEMFNKKALYLYIREYAGCQTQHITKIINRMLFTYRMLRREYLDTGIISGDFMSY